jgi:hypothetical protein
MDVIFHSGKKIDWVQIMYNSLCSELDWWYKYVKENKGTRTHVYKPWSWQRFSIFYLFTKRKNHKLKLREPERICRQHWRTKIVVESPRNALKRKNKIKEGGPQDQGLRKNQIAHKQGLKRWWEWKWHHLQCQHWYMQVGKMLTYHRCHFHVKDRWGNKGKRSRMNKIPSFQRLRNN